MQMNKCYKDYVVPTKLKCGHFEQEGIHGWAFVSGRERACVCMCMIFLQGNENLLSCWVSINMPPSQCPPALDGRP